MTPKITKVYAIQAGNDGPIKIGVAKNPRSRLKALQTGNPVPLKLLTAVTMQAWCERHIHGWLKKDRLHGEWFSPSELVLDVVDDLSIRESLGESDQTECDQDAYSEEYRKRFPEDWKKGMEMAAARV